VVLGNNILPISVVSLLLHFQTISYLRKSRCGLSQCHSTRALFAIGGEFSATAN
jgi:hypothetical protein